MFKIGEFSKLAQVPVSALRYYDQMGLLNPVEVDRFTGYRYYSASQLPRLNRILALKGLGFSLEQIGMALAEGLTPEQMRGMLRLRHAQISQQLVEMQSQLVEVDRRLHQIEQEDNVSTYDVVVKQVEPQLVASIRGIVPHYNQIGTLFGEAMTALGPHLNEVMLTVAVWYDEEYKAQDVDGEAAFMLRNPVPEVGRLRVHDLPAATMASTIHHGSYATLPQAYDAIAKWVEANGYRINGPIREVYLENSMPIRQDDPSYVTEVQFPVEKASGRD